jgi:ethanolamine utilization protein EutN
VLQPLGADREADGSPYLGLDEQGCGRGDLVITSSDGKATREMVGSNNTPARWVVIGLAD